MQGNSILEDSARIMRKWTINHVTAWRSDDDTFWQSHVTWAALLSRLLFTDASAESISHIYLENVKHCVYLVSNFVLIALVIIIILLCIITQETAKNTTFYQSRTRECG